jgi:hypothetical protein
MKVMTQENSKDSKFLKHQKFTTTLEVGEKVDCQTLFHVGAMNQIKTRTIKQNSATTCTLSSTKIPNDKKFQTGGPIQTRGDHELAVFNEHVLEI